MPCPFVSSRPLPWFIQLLNDSIATGAVAVANVTYTELKTALGVSRKKPVRTKYLVTNSLLSPPSLVAHTHISIGARSLYLGRLRAKWINSSARTGLGTVDSVNVMTGT